MWILSILLNQYLLLLLTFFTLGQTTCDNKSKKVCPSAAYHLRRRAIACSQKNGAQFEQSLYQAQSDHEWMNEWINCFKQLNFVLKSIERFKKGKPLLERYCILSCRNALSVFFICNRGFLNVVFDTLHPIAHSLKYQDYVHKILVSFWFTPLSNFTLKQECFNHRVI